MAHPSREDLVADLVGQLDRPVEMVWDRYQDRWDTGVRAWQAHDPDADWHLVIQDDALACRDLIAGLECGLATITEPAVVSCYIGDRHPGVHAIKRAEDQLEPGSWVVLGSLIWGVAIAVPTSTIADMLTWCERNHHPNYDARIARYYSTWAALPAYYTWPPLVDHKPTPSLVGHPDGRRGYRFLGAQQSALDLDWSDRSVTVSRPRKNIRRSIQVDLLVAKRSTVLHIDGRRVVIRRGVTVAEVGAEIVKGREELWEPMTVHYPAAKRRETKPPVETATAAPGEKRDLPGDDVDTAAVRAWAKDQGLDVPSRGRVPADVVQAYKTRSSG